MLIKRLLLLDPAAPPHVTAASKAIGGFVLLNLDLSVLHDCSQVLLVKSK